MQFDKDTFKPWIGNLNLKEGWNSVRLSQMEDFLNRKLMQGFDMGYVANCIASCKEFMDAIAPSLIEAGPEGQEDVVFSAIVKDGAVDGINGPKLKRYNDDIILQVGLAKYAVDIDQAGNISVGNLSGTAIIEPMTKDENGTKTPVKDKNGIPRFKASVNLMDFSNEEAEEGFLVWFDFQKDLKDAEGNFITPTTVKLNGALRNGKLFSYLAVAKDAGSAASDSEDTTWVDMRMLPKGRFKINKIVGPKPKEYNGATVNKWFCEIDGIGMSEVHKKLVDTLEKMEGFYKKSAEIGDLFLDVTQHDVEYKQVTGGFKQVPYFPDFLQAWNEGQVVLPKRGIGGEDCKHYLSLEFTNGVDYAPNPILGGIVNNALAIAVKPEPVALPASTAVATLPEPVKSAAVPAGGGEPSSVNQYDDIPFIRYMDFKW